jgi:hypothetical protein
MFEIALADEDVQGSIRVFERTVENVKEDCVDGDWFDITGIDTLSEGTCSGCDIRWSCVARPAYGSRR